MLGSVALLLAEMTPEETGRLGGVFFVAMILLAGLIKCVQIARRPTTSTLCVSSLGCVLAAWLLSAIHMELPETQVKTMLFAIVFTLLMITGLVLGIIGLIDYRRQAGRFEQGKWQAIWGILICCLMVTVITTAIFKAARKDDLLVQEISSSDDSGQGVAINQEVQVFDELNFRFRRPDDSWVQIPVKNINSVASLGYKRRNPEMWFMVIAEKLGVENEFDSLALSDLAQTNLRAGATSVQIKQHKPEVVTGVAGYRFEADAVVSGQPLSFSNWAGTHNGYAYQLTAFSAAKDRGQLGKLAAQACRSFQLIDAQRIAHVEGMEVLGMHHSPEWGYQIDFSGDPGWVYALPESLEVPAADFIGLRMVEGHQVNIGVVVFELPPSGVNAKDLLGRVAANQFNFRNKSKLLRQAVTIEGEWPQASEIAGVQSVGQAKFGYRMRLLVANDRGYLVAGWWPPECNADGMVKELLDDVKLIAPTGQIPEYSETGAAAVGLLLNELGIAEYAAGKHDLAALYFESALKHRSDQTMVENLVNAYFDANKISQAAAALDRHLLEMPGSFTLRSLKAALCRHLEDFEQAKSIYLELFSEGHDSEEDLLSYLTLAIEAEDYQAAIEVLQQFTSKYPSPQPKRWLAVMHGRNGEHQKAIDLMLKMTQEDQGDLQSLYTLAQVYELAEQYGQALLISEELLKEEPEDSSALLLKGRVEFELKRYPAAQTSFNKVLEIVPGDEEANQYIQVLSALLGKGDRMQISKIVDPVPLPPEVQQMMKDAESLKHSGNQAEFDTMDIYKVTGIAYEAGKQRRVTTYRKFKVNTLSGVDSLSTLTKSFDPLTEQLYVNRLAVFDTAGQLVAEGSAEDYYVLDDSGLDQASQDRRVHLPVPNLKLGYTVEMTVTVEDANAPESFGFEQWFLVAMNPMRLAAVYLDGDISQTGHSSSKVNMLTLNPRLRIWSTQFPPVYELEPNQAPFEEFLPFVRLGDAGKAWDEVGREYLQRIQPKLVVDAETKALAEKLVEGLTTSGEKIAALSKYVQTECTYKAIEFGVRSQVPNTAQQVRGNGYGDCKDHSVLLMQLLKSVGLSAQLALINSNGALTEDLASIGQFNHMIVYVAKDSSLKTPLFLDATEKYTTPLVPKTPGLENKLALILDPEKPYLKRTPGHLKTAGEVHIDRKIAVDHALGTDAAAMIIVEEISFNPYCSRGMRGYLQGFAPRERRNAIRDLVAEVERVRISKLEVINLNQPTKNLVLRLQYTIPKSLKYLGEIGQSQRLLGEMPAVWERYLLEVDHDDSRVTPFELTLPLSVASRTELRLPIDYSIMDADALVHEGQSKFLSWGTRVEQGEKTLVFESSAVRHPGSYAPNEFEQYWKDAQRVVSAIACSIKLGRPSDVSN